MKSAACLFALSATVCFAVLADEPPSSAPQPPAAPVQAPAPIAASSASDAKPDDVKPVPATAAAPVAKVDKTEVASTGPTEAEIKQMRGRGFKPVNRNGTLVFCRDEAEIGTHFQRTRCSTLDQLKQAELTGKEYVNSIQQQGSAVPFKGP
jgi:3-oxoacyl-ACP reductase-like protein